MPVGTGEAAAGRKPPAPSPNKTDTSWLSELAVRMSGFPSPSISQTTTSCGLSPVGNGDPSAGSKSGT